MIAVVSAVIHRAGRVLLTQRRHDKDFAWAWESPGGKVEGNESHHDALKREVGEELGVDVRAIAQTPIWSGDFRNAVTREDRREIFLLMYPVALAYSPIPREGQGIGWFTADEMRALTLAPGNRAAADAIAKWTQIDQRARCDRVSPGEGSARRLCHEYGAHTLHRAGAMSWDDDGNVTWRGTAPSDGEDNR